MDIVENNKKAYIKNLAVFLIGVIVMFFAVTALANFRFNAIEKNTREQIANQESVLVEIAVITARNGADAVTESIVHDCTINERVRFDALLSRLDSNLSNAELIELERLFGRCGSFYSERKSVMVSRLIREIEVYTNYVNQLSIILNEDVGEEYSLLQWQNLALEEQKNGDLFAKLVELQDRIITTLLEGKSANSEEIEEILLEVNQTQQSLAVINTQISQIRSGLVALEK